jgi:hypothetical protein
MLVPMLRRLSAPLKAKPELGIDLRIAADRGA